MQNSKGTRIFDLHCDTLDRLALQGDPAYVAFTEHDRQAGIPKARMGSLAENDAHIALDRMQAFDWCQCFAVFVPDTLRGEAAWNLFRKVQGFFVAQVQAHGAMIEQVRDARSIEDVMAGGKCAALLTVEGGSFLQGSLDHIGDMAEAGVKMLTLTWNAKSAIGSGNDTHDGLTAFGRDVVRALERKRIVVDVSHLNAEGFDDVLRIATRPVAASHSNARYVCDHPRNLTDRQFRAISETGGIVGLNFCNDFLSAKRKDPTREDVLAHIGHWLDLGGERTIALGSDYDGTDVPSWLEGSETLPALFDAVQERFGPDTAQALFFENAKRFFIANEGI